MATALRDLPEVEYLDGRPHPKVSPRRTHSLVQLRLGRILADCAGARGEVGTEWRFDVGAVDATDTEFIPDVAFVSYERLRALSDDEAEEPPLAPDVAIEIRSPSGRISYLRRKIERYLKNGCSLVLDVDPAQRTIVAHALSGTRTFRENDTFAHHGAPWLTFAVASAFPPPRSRA